MSISSVNNSSSAMMMKGMQRPDPSKMAEDLFLKLDTTGKGYIEKSDLESALGKVSQSGSTSSSSSTSADDMFSKMDSDGNGKVTKEEMSATIQKIASELDGQSPRIRMQGGTPPLPPQGGDQKPSSTNSTTSSQTSDPADTNGDGKVSAIETLAYELSQASSSIGNDTSSSSTSRTSSSDAHFMKQMMQLLHSYGSFDQSADNSSFSTSA